MLISILINVHYLQNIVSSFQEDSNGQNHSLSDSHQPRFPTLLLGGFSPVKNTGDGSIYIPPKLQRVEIFFSESTSYVTLMKNNTTSKRKASLQCPPTLPAGGGGLKICYVCQKERGLALFEFLKAEWIFPGGGRGGGRVVRGFSESNLRLLIKYHIR